MSKVFLTEKESKVTLNSNTRFNNNDCQEEQVKSSSHENEKIKLFTLSFTLLVVKHAKMSSIGAAERKFRVYRKRIREWIKNESKIQSKVSSNY